jgi:hypothetical protein
MRSEFGERLRVIEADIEKIQKYMGRLWDLPKLGEGPLLADNPQADFDRNRP